MYSASFSEGFGYLDAILNSFIVSVGQADFDNYSKDEYTKNRNLVWIIFVFATIFVQIILLNMLIAVMADSYDYV